VLAKGGARETLVRENRRRIAAKRPGGSSAKQVTQLRNLVSASRRINVSFAKALNDARTSPADAASLEAGRLPRERAVDAWFREWTPALASIVATYAVRPDHATLLNLLFMTYDLASTAAREVVSLSPACRPFSRVIQLAAGGAALSLVISMLTGSLAVDPRARRQGEEQDHPFFAALELMLTPGGAFVGWGKGDAAQIGPRAAATGQAGHAVEVARMMSEVWMSMWRRATARDSASWARDAASASTAAASLGRMASRVLPGHGGGQGGDQQLAKVSAAAAVPLLMHPSTRPLAMTAMAPFLTTLLAWVQTETNVLSTVGAALHQNAQSGPVEGSDAVMVVLASHLFAKVFFLLVTWLLTRWRRKK
jgi:hypothetical protein